MKVLENKEHFPPYKFYEDVEDKFLNFTYGCRVLPARYFNEHQLLFTLKKRHEPGENKYFPNGGFEIEDPEGGVYNFELNEVIVHPYQLGMTRYFSKIENIDKQKVKTSIGNGKRGRPRKVEGDLKAKTIYKPTGGQRGRKPLDPEVKAARELIIAEKKAKSNGKRGRPKSLNTLPKTEKVYVPTGGKRGRPKTKK